MLIKHTPDTYEKLHILGGMASDDILSRPEDGRVGNGSQAPYSSRKKNPIPGVYRAAMPNGKYINLMRVMFTDLCLSIFTNDTCATINQIRVHPISHRAALSTLSYTLPHKNKLRISKYNITIGEWRSMVARYVATNLTIVGNTSNKLVQTVKMIL